MRVTVKKIRNATAALLVACLAIKVGLHPWSGATTDPHNPYVVSLLMKVKHLPPRNGADLAPGPVHVYVWKRSGSTYFKVSPFRNTIWYVPVPPRNYFFVTFHGHILLINRGFSGPKAPFLMVLRKVHSIHVTDDTITLVGDGYLVFDVSRIVLRHVPAAGIPIPVVGVYNPPTMVVDGRPRKTYVGPTKAVVVMYKKGPINFGAVSVYGNKVYVVFKKGKYYIRFAGKITVCWTPGLQGNVTFEDVYWRFQYWPYRL